MTTRTEILAAIARDLGWPTGTISSGDGTSAVLGNHIGAFGDDSYLAGYTLMMPGAATSADQERTIEYWDDSEGKATWVRGRTDVTYTSETYFLVPPGDYTRQDIYTAINDSLGRTRTSVPTVLPTVDGQYLYRLNDLPWLRSVDDVDGAFYRASPNMLDNAQFDVWGDGPSAGPTSWELSGTSATAARTTTGVSRGVYGAVLTRAGTNAVLSQSIGLMNGQLLGVEVTFGCWVRTTGGFVDIRLSDGVTITSSSVHTGGGGDEFLTVTKTISTSATLFSASLNVRTADGEATFSGAMLVEGAAFPTVLTDTGDHGYKLVSLQNPRLRQIGGQPALETLSAHARRGQIVVFSGQPYPDLTADTDETLCPIDVIVPGAVYELTSRMRKGQDRTRIEVLMQRRRADYIAMSRSLRDYPVIAPRGPVQVIGA